MKRNPKDHLHLLLLQPPTTTHSQTKKHNLANANIKKTKPPKKNGKNRKNNQKHSQKKYKKPKLIENL